MNKDDFWKQCLGHIRSSISDQAYSTWFEGLELISLTNEELTIQVPNKFHFEWIESKYRHLIDESIKKVGSHPLVVNYSIVISNKSADEIPSLVEQPKAVSQPFNKHTKLHNRYIFDNFIEGDGNQFAKAAAISVAENPGQTPFNPLLIYSNPGLGKTHLIQAIGNKVMQTKPSLRVVYITSEQFMHYFIRSIQQNKSSEFASSYRNVDMLLLDDVQFFQSKQQTQEQFFHLFNDLYQKGKQIVLTTDKHPTELVGLKERLISRFQSGLIVDIQSADLETRIAILLKEAQEGGLEIPYNIVEFIATSIKNDIRAMKGALIRLLAISSLKRIDINMELAKQVLEDILGKSTFNNVTINHVIKYISRELKISEKQLIGKGRTMEVAMARQIAMYLCREYTSSSLTNIGLYFGKRDHSTVIHACRNIENKMNDDNELKKKIDSFKENLSQ